jgi:hypothetical protein
MADEITVDGLAKMSVADYKAVAKKAVTWGKAKGVVVFDDYKMEGKKKMAIGIPFRKENEMEAEYKIIKKKKTHKLSKTAVCLISMAADGITATLEIKKGGLKPELLKAAALDFLSHVGISNVNITGQSDEAIEGEEPEEGDDSEPTASVEAVKSKAIELIKSITSDGKGLSEVIARIKSAAVAAQDLGFVQQLSAKIKSLAELLSPLGKNIDEKIKADAEKINGTFAGQVQQVLTKLESAKPTASVAQGTSDLQKALQVARDKVKAAAADLQKMDKDLDKLPSSFLPSGKSILSAVGL